MKNSTKRRKETANHFQQMIGRNNFAQKITEIISVGKKAVDSLNHELGKMMVESIFLMDRENISGPDYAPNSDAYKWAHQGGSVYRNANKNYVWPFCTSI